MIDPSKHSTASYKTSQDEEVKKNVANFWAEIEEKKKQGLPYDAILNKNN